MLPFKEDFFETIQKNGCLPPSSIQKKFKLSEQLSKLNQVGEEELKMAATLKNALDDQLRNQQPNDSFEINNQEKFDKGSDKEDLKAENEALRK